MKASNFGMLIFLCIEGVVQSASHMEVSLGLNHTLSDISSVLSNQLMLEYCRFLFGKIKLVCFL